VQKLLTDASLNATYNNADIVAVNQDKYDGSGLGSVGGRRVLGDDSTFPVDKNGGGLSVWSRNLVAGAQNGATALLMINTNTSACGSDITHPCSTCDAACLHDAGIPDGDYYVRDLFTQTDLFNGKSSTCNAL